MNLMKNFNLNYLLQNLKKSRTILAIFIGLIPILNTIILIMTLTNNPNHILNFAEISIINIIGIYILPIIISICLFNYIYKKKSVDFINSMPISRKSIFITNTILGIMIFTSMLLVNAILIWAVTAIFNTAIPFMMLVDYFWFFLIVYIFVFSATNLAMTISGNAITQIIVTLLLLFLVPYTSFYTTVIKEENSIYQPNLVECKEESCKPEKYYCYEDVECELNQQINRYHEDFTPVIKNKYTTPFGLFYSLILGESTIINTISIIKMLLLSVTYIILGYFLFLKRKMEVSETTFKNIHIHNLVKSLTLVPIVSITYYVVKNQALISIIFVVVMLLIYYLIYDLITKKNIQNIKLSCIYFLVTIIVLTSIFSIMDRTDNKEIILKYTDIKEIAIDLSDNLGQDANHKIYLNNKELISLMVKSMLDHDVNSIDSFETYFKTKDNKEYKTYVNLNEENYNKVINLLSKEKSYINNYKNINMNETYTVVKLGNKIYKNNEAKPYLNLINNTLKNLSLKEFLELQQKYGYIRNEYFIKVYTYKNHNIEEFSINAYINYDLLNTIVNSNNSLLKENITPIIPSDYYIYYENAYLNKHYNIDYYVIRSAKQELYEFILKNISDEVDMRQEYFSFNIQLNYQAYTFTTNKVEEIKAILDNKQESIKDTPDYQDYYDYSKEESVEYYD